MRPRLRPDRLDWKVQASKGSASVRTIYPSAMAPSVRQRTDGGLTRCARASESGFQVGSKPPLSASARHRLLMCAGAQKGRDRRSILALYPPVLPLPEVNWRVGALDHVHDRGPVFLLSECGTALPSRTSCPQSLSFPGPASISGIRARNGFTMPSASAPSARAATRPLSTDTSGLAKLPRI